MTEIKLCSIDGCSKPAKGRGWCAAHWWRWRNHGDPLALSIKPEKPSHCKVDGCDKPPTGRRGMCNGHYLKWHRYGDPNIRFAASPGETYQWLLDHVDYDGDGCLTWPFATGTDGRGMLSAQYQGTPQAHRVMCILVNGKPPSNIHEAAHSCGKGHEACVHPKHLSWKTPMENTNDKISHGTMLYGVDVAGSKLNPEAVFDIRSGRMSVSGFAAAYGVDPETVRDVLAGRTWKWL